jgi:aminoglycoside phosphotransferase family enzyme
MSAMIEDLMHPSAFPEKPEKITFVQTHISTVFIGDEFVYKIKKPVNFGFLDFSTLEKRAYYCNKEVDLNNRFSKGVYLGVYTVNFDGDKYKIDGSGEIVDYAVKMRRLPDEDLMKSRFKDGKVKSDEIKRIGEAIANIHKKADRSKEIDEFGKIDSIKVNTDENFQQTSKFIDNSISKEQYDTLKKWTDRFYEENQELFNQRIKNGNIRDCHGDLHMEHVCLTDPIIIFDCIEFNDRFRYIDTLSDIAFLLMDLEFNGGEDLSKELRNSYLTSAGEKNDNLVISLLDFYKVYRAYVRGKVNSLILTDKNVPDEKKLLAKNTAQKYFSLAYSYTLK